MKKIVVFDTAIGTGNKGDAIIMEGAKYALKDLLYDNYVYTLGTHVINYTNFQVRKNKGKTAFMKSADYKFIMGTNWLTNKLFRTTTPQANVNPFNCVPYKGAILFGVGVKEVAGSPDWYSRHMYQRMLSHEYIHSVRDDWAKEKLEKMGFSALNTGCPTLWRLTEEFCSHIPSQKSDQTILTVSAHYKDPVADQKMIDVVRKNYDKIYLWGQTLVDEKYFNTLKNIEGIEVIRSLEKYHDILSSQDIDYVGTRLHGGIYAMCHYKRAIIISVDHRAGGMNEIDTNRLARENIDNLDAMINSEFQTKVALKTNEIDTWMRQFV
jgi:hypothetical protein